MSPNFVSFMLAFQVLTLSWTTLLDVTFHENFNSSDKVTCYQIIQVTTTVINKHVLRETKTITYYSSL